MKTSAKGIAALEHHEGVVLKAYRDPVGIWTIGAGLTKASGVVTPVAGMTITNTKASKLLARALERNYEPAVRREMKSARQAEFDAGVSFHFNTGAIGRASWVRHWRKGAWAKVEPAIKAWRKGGGRVLPGLVHRRADEYRMLRHGIYPGQGTSAAHMSAVNTEERRLARFVVALPEGGEAEVAKAFASLGYEASRGKPILRSTVLAFQRDHDLTVDGLIGKATLSTLQRRLDARRKSAQTAVAGSAAPAAEAGLGGVPDWVLYGGIAVCALLLVYLAYTYRDALAAKLQRRAPKLSTYLRSF